MVKRNKKKKSTKKKATKRKRRSKVRARAERLWNLVNSEHRTIPDVVNYLLDKEEKA